MVKKDLKIALGSDHGGYELKEKVKAHLNLLGYIVSDFGTNSTYFNKYLSQICPKRFTTSSLHLNENALLGSERTIYTTAL